MIQRDTLLRYILDHPAEDAARLVYADYLDELGGEANRARAEFIRMQVSGAPGGIRPGVREEQLLRRWGMKWVPKKARVVFGHWPAAVSGNFMRLSNHTTEEQVTFNFERGFIRSAAFRTTRPKLPARACGQLVKHLLAGNPVGNVTFDLTYRRPGLMFQALKTHAGTDVLRPDSWYAHFRLTHEMDLVSMRYTGPFPTRAAFCAGLVQMFETQLAGVKFQSVGTSTPIPF